MNRWLKETWLSEFDFKVCSTVACFLCQANIGWPCTSLARHRPSSTAHADRIARYFELMEHITNG